MDLALSAQTIAILVGAVIPALVALVTKQLATSRYKNLALIALSALSGVLVPVVGDETVSLSSIATAFATTFGTAVLAYYGLYKPQGITDGIQARLPGGLGSAELPDFEELEDVEFVDDTVVDGPTINH